MRWVRLHDPGDRVQRVELDGMALTFGLLVFPRPDGLLDMYRVRDESNLDFVKVVTQDEVDNVGSEVGVVSEVGDLKH